MDAIAPTWEDPALMTPTKEHRENTLPEPVSSLVVDELDNGKTVFSDPENSSAFLVSDTRLSLREVQ